MVERGDIVLLDFPFTDGRQSATGDCCAERSRQSASHKDEGRDDHRQCFDKLYQRVKTVGRALNSASTIDVLATKSSAWSSSNAASK